MIDEWGALLPGQRIAGYEIRRKLGQGGFGIAYEGVNEDLGIRAAIKEFFPRELVGRSGSIVTVRDGEYRGFYERFLNRFVEEARTLHKLDHPSIVKVRHFERANNTAYVVMDFIDGSNLKGWLDAKGKAVTEAELRQIFSPLMDALTYVHGENVLHRDLSPLNIMVDRSGKPWLIDFGAFKSMWQDQPRRTTVMAANPAYAPPEQVDEMSGQEHGPFTDVYALAATMYEAVSGRRPASAVSRTTALAYGRRDPLTSLVDMPGIAISTDLKRAIMNALAVDPSKRTPTVAAFKADAGWVPSRAGDVTGAGDSKPERKAEQPDLSKTLRLDEQAHATSHPGHTKAGLAEEPVDEAGRSRSNWLPLAWLVLAPLATYLLGVFSVGVGTAEKFLAIGFLAGMFASVAAAIVLASRRQPSRASIELAVYWLGSCAIVGFFLEPVLHFLDVVKRPTAAVVAITVFLIGSASYLVYRKKSGDSVTVPPHENALDASSTGTSRKADHDRESSDGAERRGSIWPALAWLVAAAGGTLLTIPLFSATKWKIANTHEGEIATGLIVGAVLSVASALALARSRRPSRTSAELGVYWLGAAAIVGFCLWPSLDIMQLIRHPTSMVFGFTAFLIGAGAYLVYRKRL